MGFAPYCKLLSVCLDKPVMTPSFEYDPLHLVKGGSSHPQCLDHTVVTFSQLNLLFSRISSWFTAPLSVALTEPAFVSRLDQVKASHWAKSVSTSLPLKGPFLALAGVGKTTWQVGGI